MSSSNRHWVMQAMTGVSPDMIPHHNSFNEDFVARWQQDKNSTAGPDAYYHTALAILIGDESFFPSQKAVVKEEETTRIIRDGWGRTARIGKDGKTYFSEQLDTVLKEYGDLDKLVFESPSDESRYRDLPRQMKYAEETGKCMFAKIGGLYCRCHFLRGEDQLLMDMALDEVFCDELFDRAAAHFTAIALETLKRTDTWDTGLWIYDDMAGTRAPLFSPAMYERYFLPRYRQIIETVKAAGCKRVIFHSDGNLTPVFELLLDAGFDGFNPLEPRCGMNVLELRRKYGGIYFGGVCNTEILPRGDHREIERHVSPILEAARDGWIIPGFASASGDIATEAYDFYYSLVQKFNSHVGHDKIIRSNDV